jgi:hypothetical protein
MGYPINWSKRLVRFCIHNDERALTTLGYYDPAWIEERYLEAINSRLRYH